MSVTFSNIVDYIQVFTSSLDRYFFEKKKGITVLFLITLLIFVLISFHFFDPRLRSRFRFRSPKIEMSQTVKKSR